MKYASTPVDFFKRVHHGRVTSYDLCRQVIQTQSKSRLNVLNPRRTLPLFFPFNETIIIEQNWFVATQFEKITHFEKTNSKCVIYGTKSTYFKKIFKAR